MARSAGFRVFIPVSDSKCSNTCEKEQTLVSLTAGWQLRWRQEWSNFAGQKYSDVVGNGGGLQARRLGKEVWTWWIDSIRNIRLGLVGLVGVCGYVCVSA